MLRRTFLFVLIALGAITGHAQSLTDKLDEYMSANATQGKFNGVVLVAKDGKILLHKGYGWRDARKRQAHDENSVFQIGSVTKQFTAVIILHLQEQGKLKVTDTISQYIPDLPNGNRITIQHLLRHTSGVFNYTNDNAFMATEAVKPVPVSKLIDVFRNKPLDFAPDSRFSYSNSGYVLLGYIIQKVSGKPYEQMVREVIFRPAQMSHSGFDFKALRDPGKSVGYFTLGTDTVAAPIVDSSVSFSAGSIYSTASDLYRWHKVLYTDKVIKQPSLEQAFTPGKNRYGYGWVIETRNNKRVITHNGGIFGFTADMLRVPEDSACIILLSNKPDNLGGLTRGLYAILYGEQYEIPKEKTVVTVPDTLLQQYVGEYELTSTFRITVTLENGQLKGQATGQEKFDLFAERENYFFLKVVDAQVEFSRGANGKVDKLILFQGGARQTAMKVK